MKNSVVMATYNGERFIIEQLDSIKNQTLAPDEVVICDDCSTDNTVRVIKDYIKSNNLYNWNIFENSVNFGFYDNFFNALKKSTGDIIFFSDQDDIWDLNKIEVFNKQYLCNPEIMMIQSNIKYIDECGNPIESNKCYHNINSGHIVNLSIYDLCKFCGSGFTMSIRKNISEKIFKEAFDKKRDIFEFHDVVLGLTSISEGKCVLNRAIVDSHRLHDKNVTEQKNKTFLSNRTKNDHLDILRRREKIFTSIATSTTDNSKSKVFFEFSKFARCRYKYIDNFSLCGFYHLLSSRKMYGSKVGFFSDILYSIGLEKIILSALAKHKFR